MEKIYKRGRDKEYRVKRKMEKEGYIVLRTAGSHGFADLIAVHPVKKVIKFVQCKGPMFPDAQMDKLRAAYGWLHFKPFYCYFEVI